MTGWFDSHAHLWSLSAGADAALGRARAAGVDRVVCVGTDAGSSQASIAVATGQAGVWATVGLHPHDASRLDEEWDTLVALASDPTVVAIGETGLDFYYGHSPADAQEESFRRHIALAKELDRAVVIHTRDAWPDTFRILEDVGTPARAVFHCFTGGPDEARAALELGAWLSFSGVVSFRNADDVRAAAVVTPPDRLLVETDAPYLAPVPHRGQENEPAFVPAVGAAVAAARGLDPDRVRASTAAATAAAFGLDRVL